MAERGPKYPELLRRPDPHLTLGDPDMTPRPQSASTDLELHEACRKGRTSVVCDLLAGGADVEMMTSRGETPAILAAQFLHPELLRALFDRGADFRVTDPRGMTPLCHVCQAGYVELFRYLQERMKDTHPGYIRENHRKLFRHACAGGCIEMVEYLLGQADTQEDVLHSLIALFQDGGDDVMRCMVKLHGILHTACEAGSLEVVQFLISQGSEVTAITEFGQTPLHCACAGGREDVVRHLVELPAVDAHVKDFRGLTPMHMACLSGSLGSVTCLIERGADITESCDEGVSGLDLVCNEGHLEVVEYLLGADLVKDVNSALYAACEGGHVAVIEALIKHGGDVHATHEFGETAIFAACQNRQLHAVEFLHGAGADLDACTGDGVSVLSAASEVGDLAIIHFLLREGATVELFTEEGRSALHAAWEGEHVQAAELLWREWLSGKIRHFLSARGARQLHLRKVTTSDLKPEITLADFLQLDISRASLTLKVIDKDRGDDGKVTCYRVQVTLVAGDDKMTEIGEITINLTDLQQDEINALTNSLESLSM